MDCHATASHHFCPKCGQKTRSPRGHFRILIADFFNSWLGAEAKLWPTIWRLLRRPGALTLDYREGRRTRYLSPLKIYFFFSVVFFLLLNWTTNPNSVVRVSDDAAAHREESAQELLSEMTDMPAEDLAGISAEELAEQIKAEAYANPSTFTEVVHQGLPLQSTWLGNMLKERLLVGAAHLDQMPADQANRALTRQIFADLPVALFLALPIIALALRMVFWRRNLIYFDHFIYTLHLVAFFFAAMIFAKAVGLIPLPSTLGVLLTIAFALLLWGYFLQSLKVSTGRGYLGGLLTSAWLGLVLVPTMVVTFVGLLLSSVLKA